MKDQFIALNIKKGDKKNTTNKIKRFGVNWLFVLVYINNDNNAKRFNARKYYLPKGTMKKHLWPSNWFDIKRYEEIRKLTIAESEDYATGCLLEYDYIKDHYRLIAGDLSWQKELDTDRKATQQIEFLGQLKNLDADDNATDAGNDQSMFILTILEERKKG